MDDRTALLNAIKASPDEDLPRLMYADWLDETGQTGRAAFVRAQCHLSRVMRDHPDGRTCDWDAPVCAKCKDIELARDRVRRTLANREAITPVIGTAVWSWHGAEEAVTVMTYAVTAPFAQAVFRRGLIESLTVAAADLPACDTILASHPIQEARLTTWPAGQGVEHKRDGRHGHRYRFRGQAGWFTEQECEAVGKGSIYAGLLVRTWPAVKSWLLPQTEVMIDPAAPDGEYTAYIRQLNNDILEALAVPAHLLTDDRP